MRYPRDMVGYGRDVPYADWPGNARVALQFVLNYEEGAESSVLHGDAASEQFLSEIVGAAAYPARHLSMESIYEYGARVGVWRLLELFKRYRAPLTVFGVAMAMERNPAAVEAFLKAGHEIASHGWSHRSLWLCGPRRTAEEVLRDMVRKNPHRGAYALAAKTRAAFR